MNPEQLYTHFKTCSEICTDSRKVTTEAFFFAIKGDNFDGNRYAVKALESGAKYAVVSDPKLKGVEGCIFVKDTLVALQELARHHRRQFDIPFIAITGTNGKTTTKELLSAVLSTTYKTHFTKGNFNNHIGVPLTLLEIEEDTEIAVIEMGANHIGEIDFLCRIAEPTHGIITNIGKAHLEGFGSQEGIKKTKSELYRFLEETGGTAFVNTDQAFLKDLAGAVTIISYGSEEKNDYKGTLEGAAPYLKFSFAYEGEWNVNTQIFGRYNYDNALTATAIGLHFKVLPAAVKAGLEAYVSSNNRSQVVKEGTNTFYLDAYNANPTSMRLAIENFAALPFAKKFVVLGDMLELGEYSELEHTTIIDQLVTLYLENKLSPAILVGSEFGKVDRPAPFRCFSDVKALKKWFRGEHFNEAHFLVKGSRGIRLEELLK